MYGFGCVSVMGNAVVLLLEGIAFSAICAHVGRGMKREEWTASQRYEGHRLGAGEGEVARGNLRHERVL